MHQTVARAAVASLRTRELAGLVHDDIAFFRNSFFKPEIPVVLPRGKYLAETPAVRKWFIDSPTGSRPNYSYLEKYGDCNVPLELTIPSNDGVSFAQSYAPLSFFLRLSRSLSEGDAEFKSISPQTRVYLAQCQLFDLPHELRADFFPTPALVSFAGKGDVYDTNVWMGLPPTYTPLHQDPNPNLFVQIAGTKQVRLCSPDVGLRIFAQVKTQIHGTNYSDMNGLRHNAAFRGEEMMQGLERKLLDREVWGDPGSEQEKGEHQNQNLVGYETTLNAGDGLFIPKGWWHSLKGVGHAFTASVSMSFPSASSLIRLGKLVVQMNCFYKGEASKTLRQ